LKNALQEKCRFCRNRYSSIDGLSAIEKTRVPPAFFFHDKYSGAFHLPEKRPPVLIHWYIPAIVRIIEKVEKNNMSNFFKTQTLLFVAATALLLLCGAFSLVSAGFPVRSGFCANPATNWKSALLSGNGRMGIMVCGGALDDTVIFDANTLYQPKTQNAYVPDISSVQEAVKDDIMAGNCKAAAQRQLDALHAGNAVDGGEGARHAGYKMLLSIPAGGTISKYSRSCNFETGEISVQWTDDRGAWTRKAFVSRSDSCVVQYFTAPTNGKINCSIQLSSDLSNKPASWTFTNIVDTLNLNMRVKYQTAAGDQGYEGVTRVIQKGGTKSVSGTILTISNADTLLLLTRLARYASNCTNLFTQKNIQNQLSSLTADYASLTNRHTAIIQPIYNRVKIDLGGDPSDRALSNEALMLKQVNSTTPVKAFWERAFDAGRYYYLSASCSETPPAGVGVWTGDFSPEWGGYYHTDANLNVTIGGGNIGDMPEAMEGYFNLIEGWVGDWKYNATHILGCRGLLPDGNGPAGAGNGLELGLSIDFPYQYFTGRTGWLLYPFWEHYLVTGDKTFLSNRLYPLLQQMGYFYEDFLKRTDSNGNYIFVGSISPENAPSNATSPLVINSTIDIAGAKFLLKTVIAASNQLGVEQGAGQGIERWTAILNKLPPYLINSDGALKEWSWPSLSDKYNHRHISHLITVWPLKEISPEETPALMAPALKALQLRGYEDGSGHGVLMRALVGAGLKDKASVYANIMMLLKNNFLYSSLFSSHFNINNSNTFWSDVANTLPTIMMEMLVDSKPGVIELLPAVPDQIDNGTIVGIKARNRTTVQNLNWNLNTKVVSVTLNSVIDQDIKLINRRGIAAIQTSAPVKSPTPASDSTIARVVTLKAGQATTITIGFVPGAVTAFVPAMAGDPAGAHDFNLLVKRNRITFDLPSRLPVTLAIYSPDGRKIYAIVNSPFEKGSHSISMGDRVISAGCYFLQLTVGNRRVMQSFVRE
jgi:alpha-L-fucosidase 2